MRLYGPEWGNGYCSRCYRPFTGHFSRHNADPNRRARCERGWFS